MPKPKSSNCLLQVKLCIQYYCQFHLRHSLSYLSIFNPLSSPFCISVG